MNQSSEEFIVINDMEVSLTPDDVLRKIHSIDVSNISFETLGWDKWDFIMVGISGFIGGLFDVVLGRPQGFDEPKIKDDSLFGLGKKINEYNLKNNPIDYQDPTAFGGDHRLYSYGHDLFRFFDGVRQTMYGEYHGISPVGWGEMVRQFPGYQQMNFTTALLVNVLHLFKDFWTARSLPIPGMTYLANLNGNEMPQFAKDLYVKHGVNLRVLTGQALSVAFIELILRVYMFLRYRTSDVPREQITTKRNQLLLAGHGVSMLFNVGKIIVSKNPFLLNVPQLLMIVRYALPLLLKSLKSKREMLNTHSQNNLSYTQQMITFFEGLSSYASILNSYTEIREHYGETENTYRTLESGAGDTIGLQLEAIKRKEATIKLLKGNNQ